MRFLKPGSFASEFLDGGRDFLGARFVRPVAKSDVRAFLGEALRDGEADTLAASSDGYDFSCQTIAHDSLLAILC